MSNHHEANSSPIYANSYSKNGISPSNSVSSPSLQNSFDDSKFVPVSALASDSRPRKKSIHSSELAQFFSEICSNMPDIGNSNLHDPSNMENALHFTDTLTNYLDRIELDLISEISSRSNDFFLALSTLQSLYSETSSVILQISKLKADTTKIKDEMYNTGSSVVKLNLKKSNLEATKSAVNVLINILQALPIVLDLIDSRDSSNALNLLAEIEELLLVNQSLPALSHSSFWNSKVYTDLTLQISSALSSVSEFVLSNVNMTLHSLLIDFVSSNFQSWEFNSPLIMESIFQAHLATNQNIFALSLGFSKDTLLFQKSRVENSIKHLFNGILRAGKAINLVNSVSSCCLCILDEFLDQDYSIAFSSEGLALDFNDAKLQESFANSLRSMTFDKYIDLLRNHMGRTLLLTQNVLFIIEIMLQSYNQNLEPASSQSTLVTEKLDRLLDSVFDTANIRINKILIHRRDQIAKVNTSAFYSLFFLVRSFIYCIEFLARRQCFSIRSCLSNLSKLHFENFHKEKLKQLFIIIENEQWVQADVPIDFQQLLDNLVKTSVQCSEESTDLEKYSDQFFSTGGESVSTQLPMALTPYRFSYSNKAGVRQNANNQLRTNEAQKNKKNDSGMIVIEGSSIPVVGSVLSLLKTVYEYVQIAAHFPNLTTSGLSHICIFLKSFNSRTCQVILGAGAVCSAGLKHISAKHISLVTRALDLALLIIGYIEKIFVFLLGENRTSLVLSSFESARIDYKDHKRELLTKLVKIMSDRADVHVAKLAATNWENLVDISAISPSAISNINTLDQKPTASIFNSCKEAEGIKLIIKENKKLHKILIKYLIFEDLSTVFDDIIDVYNAKILSSMNYFKVNNTYSKLAIIYNIQFLEKELGTLPGIKPLTKALEIAANNINLVLEFASPTHHISNDIVLNHDPNSSDQNHNKGQSNPVNDDNDLPPSAHLSLDQDVIKTTNKSAINDNSSEKSFSNDPR
ncbi:hypothetical protein BB560_004873 [Smittium megazygosporum]|uniref:Vacuolar protein sorting-associated protein 54 C-terminal domain-containing protein n=1 Tax=Smittium megazygosporum TaxID=133381 RepID=A0A2T9Z805_9FUNG|nr:hypothetical protein BB560_004873 [Smittium megazygosporum]